jgi:hypothetical protein
MQLVNMTHTDMSLEKTFSSSGLVNMQSFRQLSRKLVWWPRTSSMLEAYRERAETQCCVLSRDVAKTLCVVSILPWCTCACVMSLFKWTCDSGRIFICLPPTMSPTSTMLKEAAVCCGQGSALLSE